MVVILAIVGIIVLLCVSGSRKASHATFETRQSAIEQFKNKYCETYKESLDDEVFLARIGGEERERIVRMLKDILCMLPHGERYAANINEKTDLSHQFFREILCAMRGKIMYRINLRVVPVPSPKILVGGTICGVENDEKTFEFQEARLDWIVSELKRHGVDVPLYARSNQWSETRTVDWKGNPHYSGKFFVPYKERPLDKSCDLVWNYEGKPPIYPS